MGKDGGPDLRERVERMFRRRADLQARQQLLVAGQLQTERERVYARREVEVVREELSQLRAGRLRANEERLSALEEAAALSKSIGVGASVVEELLQQNRTAAAQSSRGPLGMNSGSRDASGLSWPAVEAPAQRPPRSGLGSSSFGVQDWSRPKEPAGGADITTWWKTMLTAPPSAADVASASAVRDRSTLQTPSQHWAQFGGAGTEATAAVANPPSPLLPPTSTVAHDFSASFASQSRMVGTRPGTFCA